MNYNNDIYDYVVVIKNNHKKTIEKTGWLFSFLTVLLLSVNLYYNPKEWLQYAFLLTIIFLIVSNIHEYKIKKPFRFGIVIIIGGIGILMHSTTPNIIGWLFILAGILEKKILQNREIGFSKNAIIENGLFGKKICWEDLNQVIIKDNILTIDFKNNKLIQAETDDEDDDEYEVEADEFNTYCRNRIS